MYLSISNITGSDRDDDTCVRVTCKLDTYGDPLWFHVYVTASTVRVALVPGGWAVGRKVDIARVLVSADLVDATRRLFGLVGDA